MNLRKIVVDCSFVEREEAVRACLDMSKSLKTISVLTVYRDCIKNKAVVTITKNSKESNILRYIEKQLSYEKNC